MPSRLVKPRHRSHTSPLLSYLLVREVGTIAAFVFLSIPRSKSMATVVGSLPHRLDRGSPMPSFVLHIARHPISGDIKTVEDCDSALSTATYQRGILVLGALASIGTRLGGTCSSVAEKSASPQLEVACVSPIGPKRLVSPCFGLCSVRVGGSGNFKASHQGSPAPTRTRILHTQSA